MTDMQKTSNEHNKDACVEITVKQGSCVILLGVLGSLSAIAPVALLHPSFPLLSTPFKLVISICWAIFAGWFFTYFWSNAIHNRIKKLRLKLVKENLLSEEETQYPGRIAWMPAWLGVFERGFYSLLIGLDVSGGAAFIGVWVGFKLTSGWQAWGKGTTYSRAIRFAGLLGDAMSLSYGVISGIVIKKLLCST